MQSFALVAYGAETGDKLWTARYDGPGVRYVAWDGVMSPEGATVFVTGWGKGGSTLIVGVAAAFDAADGTFFGRRARDRSSPRTRRRLPPVGRRWSSPAQTTFGFAAVSEMRGPNTG